VGGARGAWGKGGLSDLGARGSRGAAATYPSEGPKARLDFILLSAGLREGAKYRVIRDRRFINLSWHLPVEITLAR
jgi:endonuclease/exonuclease/phosphatase family metal-dependent hydrolase